MDLLKKKNGSLDSIDLLPGASTIGVKNIQDLLALLAVGPAKRKAVICKKEMG